MKRNSLIICRGGGDLATGIVHRLHRAGFRVLVLETDHPAAIRRQVALSEAVYSKSALWINHYWYFADFPCINHLFFIF